jgi:NAD(P)H dehydrogenase (quinone)
MTKIAVVYHSGSGHTKAQAEAVRDGAAEVEGTEVRMIAVDDLTGHEPGEVRPAWQYLDDADVIVFGSPTYMAGPSAAFKAFMDATSGRWAEQAWADKLAAGFTNSAGYSGDKLNTLEAFALLAMQHSMVWVGLGLMPGNITEQGSPEDLNRLAGFLGAMAQSNADVGPEIAPAGSDLRTAAHLGRRVAEAAERWTAGELAGAVAGAAS